MGTGPRPVSSLHGIPKPLQASSSVGLGQSSKKRHRPYSSVSSSESDDSDLEYDEEEKETEKKLRKIITRKERKMMEYLEENSISTDAESDYEI